MGADLLEEWRQLNHLVDIQVNAWVGYFRDHLHDEFFGYKGGFEGILGSWFFKEFLGATGIIWGPNKRKWVIWGQDLQASFKVAKIVHLVEKELDFRADNL